MMPELIYSARDLARCATLRTEPDAYYAKFYDLTEDELCYILNPIDVMGRDYPRKTFLVRKDKEPREYGEYRTRRLREWNQLEYRGLQ